MRDFFISYTRRDQAWAEWIAYAVEESGYSAYLHAWDFRPGSNFVLEMDRAAAESRKTLLVLSPAFLTASYTQPEWAAVFRKDPEGHERRLLPVRVEPCKPDGLLGSIVYMDLVGLAAEEAKEALLAGLAERAKPETEPAFPGPAAGSRTEAVAPLAAGSGAARVAPLAVPYPGAGRPPLPRQLPAPPADFVGREEDLAHLREAAAAGGRVAIFRGRGCDGEVSRGGGRAGGGGCSRREAESARISLNLPRPPRVRRALDRRRERPTKVPQARAGSRREHPPTPARGGDNGPVPAPVQWRSASRTSRSSHQDLPGLPGKRPLIPPFPETGTPPEEHEQALEPEVRYPSGADGRHEFHGRLDAL